MRMYVLVNKDMGKKLHKRGMTNSYHHVQANHAAIEYILHHAKKPYWGNVTLIVLGASQRQFNRYHWLVRTSNIPYSFFKEPDLNNEITAFACIIKEPDFKMFKRLKLLGKR